MISYSLTKNTMNPDAKEYIATVKQFTETDYNEILDLMVAEGTGLTRPQALAYFEKLMQIFEYLIKERGGLNIPLFNIRTTITGVFRSQYDSFDPERHQINIRILPGPRLKKLRKHLELKKVIRQKLTPSPEVLFDFTTNSQNEQLTSKGFATLTGGNLKFDPGDDRQGIFFIQVNNPKNIFRVNYYMEIKPAKIYFLVPKLPPGDYELAVHAVMRHHKSIRTGLLYSDITAV